MTLGATTTTMGVYVCMFKVKKSVSSEEFKGGLSLIGQISRPLVGRVLVLARFEVCGMYLCSVWTMIGLCVVLLSCCWCWLWRSVVCSTELVLKLSFSIVSFE